MSLGIMLEFKMINKAMEEVENELLDPYLIFTTNYPEDNRFCNF